MSETTRPWHGADNPLEALHDWVIAEIAKVRAEMSGAVEPAAEPPPETGSEQT